MMKFTNTHKLLTTILALSLSTTSFAKTYTVINSGKWSDQSIWEGGSPGKNVEETDVVVVKNHLLISNDLEINGTLIVEKGNTVVSSKSVVIGKSGHLINNGIINVRRLMNEGDVQNYASLESMMEIQNSGSFTNNLNVVSGTSLLNYGGKLDGKDGRFFANESVISSPSAKISNSIRVYSGGGLYQTPVAANEQAPLPASAFYIESQTRENMVILTVNNLKNEAANNFKIQRSFDGEQFEEVATIPNSKNEIAMLYQDKAINHPTVFYKIQVETDKGIVNLPMTAVGLSNTQVSMR